MASLAERHEVFLCVRASLGQWNDVIYDCRWFDFAGAQAQAAERLASSRLLTQSLPPPGAATANAFRFPRHQSTRKSSGATFTLTNEAAPMTFAQCIQTTCESSCHAPASVRASMTAFARLSMSGFFVRH